MKTKHSISFITALILLSGGNFSCQNSTQEDNSGVVSQRFIHKYGHEISKEEWEERGYPGQVITVLRDGVTVTTSYEGGLMHGPTTYTYPHSQTIEILFLYDSGRLIKTVNYDSRGLPVKEDVSHSATRHTITYWFQEGTPMSIEQYAGEELVEGDYFTQANDQESKVQNGKGLAIRRDVNGNLLFKDTFESGYITQRIVYHSNGTPAIITDYINNIIHGQKMVYNSAGEPVSCEEWENGVLNGKAIYFQNGMKFREVNYKEGKKEGKERIFIDGEKVSQEIEWHNDVKDGPSIMYIDEDEPVVEWYYNGKQMSQGIYEEVRGKDEKISALIEEYRSLKNR